MTNTMRIAGVELEPWEQEYLTARLGAGVYVNEHLAEASDLGDPEVLLTFIYSPITAATFKQYPTIKLVSTLSTGYDHIDLEACRKHGVIVSNVPSYGENTVAEQAFALLLALTRKIIPSVTRTKAGDFRLNDLRGMDVAGKTIGIIGTGRIGQHMIRMAKGFGMTVLGYDPFPKPALGQELGFTYVDLPALLKASDIISLHCPATPETRHILNEERLMMMPKEAILINTARGSLVDTQALVRVLDRGHLAAVGLDVLEEEYAVMDERQLLSPNFTRSVDLTTVLADHVLLAHPRVIVTPHNAFNTTEALKRILDTTVANVQAFNQGTPTNVIT